MSKPKPDLDATFEERGLWWIASAPDDKVAGIIKVSPSEITLELVGILGKLEASFYSASENLTIHGLTIGGQRVSLPDAFRLARNIKAPGITTDRYYAGFAAFGIHIADLDSPLFRASWVRLHGLEAWLSHSHFRRGYDHEARKFDLEVHAKSVETIAEFDDLEVRTGTNMYTDQRGRTGFDTTVHSCLGIRSGQARSVRWHLEALGKLQNLASLCFGYPLKMLAVELTGLDAEGDVSDERLEVHAYFSRIDDAEAKDLDSSAPVISAPELLEANPSAIQAWFEQYALLEPAMHLFFSIIGTKQLFVNVRFLLAVQALEVLHRRTASGGVCEPSDFESARKALVAAIPDTTPAALREKIKGMLNFANEPSLMQRLRSLMASLEVEFNEMPAGVGGKFCRSLVDTRNYYTHFSANLQEKCLDGSGMHWATRRIVMLFTVFVLMRLELKPEAIRAALTRHQEFNRLWTHEGEPFG